MKSHDHPDREETWHIIEDEYTVTVSSWRYSNISSVTLHLIQIWTVDQCPHPETGLYILVCNLF